MGKTSVGWQYLVYCGDRWLQQPIFQFPPSVLRLPPSVLQFPSFPFRPLLPPFSSAAFGVNGNDFGGAGKPLGWTPGVDFVAAVVEVKDFAIHVFGIADQDEAQAGLVVDRWSVAGGVKH